MYYNSCHVVEKQALTSYIIQVQDWLLAFSMQHCHPRESLYHTEHIAVTMLRAGTEEGILTVPVKLL